MEFQKTRELIQSVWCHHCQQPWPIDSSPHQGQLMTLDTVIGGCVLYYLDSPDGLDDRRLTIVRDCLMELEALMTDLDPDVRTYFLRVRQLATLLLKTASDFS